MTRSTLGILLMVFICCGWPLIFYAVVGWAKKRDWSTSGDVISKVFASLFHKDEDE